MHADTLVAYRAAITRRFPQLALDTVDYLAEGKDRVACLVNRRLLFLFPKHQRAEQKLLMESALLPELAPTLPLAIPRFDYVSSAPTPEFPRAFVGYEILLGTPLHAYIPDIWSATWWQPYIGAFVTALHRFPVARAGHLGVAMSTPDDWRGQQAAFYATVRAQVYPLVTPVQRAAISQYFEDYLGDDQHFVFEPVLLHADLHARHILLDHDQRRVTGIIDFAECRIGDPAIDVRDAWLPYYGGTVDPSWRERREFYWKAPPLAKVAYRETFGDAWVAEGLAEIGNTWPA